MPWDPEGSSGDFPDTALLFWQWKDPLESTGPTSSFLDVETILFGGHLITSPRMGPLSLAIPE